MSRGLSRASTMIVAPSPLAFVAMSNRRIATSVDAYFKKLPAEKRTLLETLRGIVESTIPDADVSIKWGVPTYQRNGRNVCALASFKDNVALNIFASPDTLADPGKRLEGAGKTSRMLKVRTAKDIEAASIKRWLKAASA